MTPERYRRWEFLQDLVDRYGFRSYLEVGCAGGRTFKRIVCSHKVGVDIRGDVRTYHGKSDDFFEDNKEMFDLVFVDGWHGRYQALRDTRNALAVLHPGGLIVLHDCNPLREQRQSTEPTLSGGWNGDVWKAFVEIRSWPRIDAACGEFDQGCGVVIPRKNTAPLRLPEVLAWPGLDRNRREWLRLMDRDQLLDWIGEKP